MAEQPNINNLEQFIEVQTGLVPTNLNDEAWVSRQSDTLGGLQSFATVTELVNFHPNKMFLYMEANVGADDKYRLTTKPALTDYPLSENIADPNYFLNFWELKDNTVVTEKKDNFIGGTNTSTVEPNYFRIAGITGVVNGTKINLKLSVQSDFLSSGALHLSATLDANSDLVLSQSQAYYVENNSTITVDPILFYIVKSAGGFDIYAKIESATTNSNLYYTVLHNESTASDWTFYENNNTPSTTLPANSTVIQKRKYSSDVVQDIRVSDNKIQQRKYNTDGSLGSYTDKSPVVASASVVSSGTRYINATINGSSNLIDIFPIVDSRLGSTTELNNLGTFNNGLTSTTLSNTSNQNANRTVTNNTGRQRTLMLRFETVVQSDGGSEIVKISARRGANSATTNETSGTLMYNNNFVINDTSIHQRDGIFFDIIPPNTSYYYFLYARVVSGGNANFYGPIKFSFTLL